MIMYIYQAIYLWPNVGKSRPGMHVTPPGARYPRHRGADGKMMWEVWPPCVSLYRYLHIYIYIYITYDILCTYAMYIIFYHDMCTIMICKMHTIFPIHQAVPHWIDKVVGLVHVTNTWGISHRHDSNQSVEAISTWRHPLVRFQFCHQGYP